MTSYGKDGALGISGRPGAENCRTKCITEKQIKGEVIGIASPLYMKFIFLEKVYGIPIVEYQIQR